MPPVRQGLSTHGSRLVSIKIDPRIEQVARTRITDSAEMATGEYNVLQNTSVQPEQLGDQPASLQLRCDSPGADALNVLVTTYHEFVEPGHNVITGCTDAVSSSHVLSWSNGSRCHRICSYLTHQYCAPLGDPR